ncbi:cyclin-K-like isoform X2 [Zophobas morio]|uniref:cyclin-K-like isoform X2 n=1 Tax=Zophobas morio TaxID=2755281 RepID=UPI003082DD17
MEKNVSKDTDFSWYFTKEQLKQTASKAHNYTDKQIERLRAEGVSFVQDIGRYMKMPQLAIATAIVFFQRFYLYQSFQDFPVQDVGSCCLFLAGKVEDSPKKLKDIIIKSTSFSSGVELKETDDEYFRKREILLRNERILLQTISFDLTVEHPYRYLLSYVKALSGDRYLAQTAWNYVNDSLRTTLCLQRPPQVISCAAIALAAKRNNYPLHGPAGKEEPWFHQFVGHDVSQADMDEIGQQILDLYTDKPDLQEEASKRYNSAAEDISKKAKNKS